MQMFNDIVVKHFPLNFLRPTLFGEPSNSKSGALSPTDSPKVKNKIKDSEISLLIN